MFDIDFLPSWYITLGNHKRSLRIQHALTVLALMAGLLVLVVQQRTVRAAEDNLGSVAVRLKDTAAQQKLLDAQFLLRKQLQARKSVLNAIGHPVDASRLLTTIEALMPRQMSLSSFQCVLEEAPQPQSAVKLATPGNASLSRKLKVKIVGFAPSDMDLASFLAAMTNVAIFQNVTPNYSSPRTEAGHVLREFEVAFWIDLMPPGSEVACVN